MLGKRAFPAVWGVLLQVASGREIGGFAAGSARRTLLLAGGVFAFGAILAPTVSNAFSSGFDSRPVSLEARGSIGSFTPASVDPELASALKVTTLQGHLFRFTPAGTPGRPDRSVTVAVRIDSAIARAVSVRGALPAQVGGSTFRVAPVAYNLGVARGYESFAAGKPVVSASLSKTGLQKIEMPDLSAFTPSQSIGQAARFAPRIALDEKDKAGRAPRTLEGQDDYQVDVGGSYRLTRNLKVIGGVRYSSDRDRITPLTDGKQDSQAVYVGTQFRF